MRNLFLLLFIWFSLNSNAQTLEGFFLNEVVSDITLPIGVQMADTNHWYIGSLPGQIHLVVDGVTEATPVIDISEEVGLWNDHGLLSFALDPDFLSNGYIYLYYTVDRHHLLYYGTSDYDSEANEYESATIARLSRYTIDLESMNTLVEAENLILLGDEISNGIPIMALSHAGGTIMFGEDGTLLLTTGDGTWKEHDGEGPLPDGNYDEQALEDGIIRPDEDLNSWRSQYIHSLNGKVLRLDKETGAGIESNPFYSTDSPFSAASRVWALGFRNPFRAALRPFSGSSSPSIGAPGDIFVGDVGYWSWEELNIVDGAGLNFGWPYYEGMNHFWIFSADEYDRYNLNEPNPLEELEGCDEYFSFHELLGPPNANPSAPMQNPCALDIEMPAETNYFHHKRPAMTWQNSIASPDPYTLLSRFDNNGNPYNLNVAEAGDEVEIEPFTGSASLGGDFYIGNVYPEDFFGAFFHSDYAGWARITNIDSENNFTASRKLLDLNNIVQMKYNPFDGHMYLTTIFPDKIYRLEYSGNLPPQIDLVSTSLFGTSPHEVTFDASLTSDNEGDEMNFQWILGDGSTNSGTTIMHTYSTIDSEPTAFEVVLVVTDSYGNSVSEDLVVHLNNTAPSLVVSGIPDFYSGLETSMFEVSVEASDLEHESSELNYEWSVFLHHNSHYHLERSYATTSAQIELNAVGCEDIESYWYRLQVVVSDPLGATSSYEQELFPNCDNIVTVDNDSPNQIVVYPNPSSEYIRIKGPFETEEKIGISIHDQSGRLFLSNKRLSSVSGLVQFSIRNLNSGVYILKVESNSLTERFRIVKQ